MLQTETAARHQKQQKAKKDRHKKNKRTMSSSSPSPHLHLPTRYGYMIRYAVQHQVSAFFIGLLKEKTYNEDALLL